MGVFGAIVLVCPGCGHATDLQSDAGDGVTFYSLGEAPAAMLEDIKDAVVECEECNAMFRVEVITIARMVRC